MNFPTIPASTKILDDQGNMNPDWYNFFDQIWLFMLVNFSNTGLVMPSLTQDEITALSDALNGTLVYNSSTSKAQVKENGAFTDIA